MKGQLDGLKFSLTTTQWMVGAILSMLAVIITIPQIQSYFKVPEANIAEKSAVLPQTNQNK